ncbi:MAG TPA: hypothetical protein VMR51_00020 [Patescibacteria group bacterium]|nr:hypothetical protein [Patescibacteria group bacterium]
MSEFLPRDEVEGWYKEMADKLPEAEDIQTISLSGDDDHFIAAVLLREDDGVWLFAETGDFEQAGYSDEFEDGVRIRTTGRQWLVNLQKREFSTVLFEYDDEGIQGLNYSLNHFHRGGELDAEAYEAFIKRLLKDAIKKAVDKQLFAPLELEQINIIKKVLLNN